jgi:hypothetical protein
LADHDLAQPPVTRRRDHAAYGQKLDATLKPRPEEQEARIVRSQNSS